MTDDDNHDANTEEGRQNLTQSISTITNESEEEELIRTYKHRLEKEEEAHRKEQVINIIKQRIWPTTKFSTSRIIEDTELMEEGNLLSEILHGMNLTNYSKTRRARFWSAEVREKRSHVADIAACSRRRLSLTAESEVDHRARHALSRQAEHIDGVTSELAAPTRRHQRIMRSARRVSVAS